MNSPIRRVAILCMVMFLALMANLTYSTVFRQDALNANPQNRRVTDARFAQDRGAILVGNAAIAQTKPVKDRFKYQRSYAKGPLYAPVTGYYSYLYGSTGLEWSHSAQLSGQARGQLIDRLIAQAAGRTPPGASLVTTINTKAQQAAWNALGGLKGAVVAIDTQTGAIKAMVSTPSFDPNALATHDIAASQATWKSLNADPDKPMLNRAAKEIYSPGSTFKLIVTAAALEHGMTPDTLVDATNYQLPQSTHVIRENCGGAKITLARSLKISCNPSFARLGAQLGADVLRTQSEKFGFGQTYLTDLGQVASKFPDNINEAQTAMSALGEYEVAATPLQMAMVAAAIANDGVVMKPYVVDEVRSADDLSVISKTQPQQASVAISPATAAGLQRMMVDVVTSGTGTRAQIPGIEVGGKTGTAVTDRVRLPYTWFVGYAKELHTAVCVFVEDPQTSLNEATGGRISAPIAKAVWEALR